MELKGKIVQMLNCKYGYILGEDGQLYLFSIMNIDNFNEKMVLLSKEVLFKPILEPILQAILISIK